jgi:hypothetical protein
MLSTRCTTRTRSRADPAGQHDEGVSQLEHPLLALVQRIHLDELGQA